MFAIVFAVRGFLVFNGLAVPAQLGCTGRSVLLVQDGLYRTSAARGKGILCLTQNCVTRRGDGAVRAQNLGRHAGDVSGVLCLAAS